jgi:hypothetical protein
MNGRQRMTARYLELWNRTQHTPDELEAMLRREFPSEPPSVHDAAVSAGIREKAREIHLLLEERIRKYMAAEAAGEMK